MNRGGAFVHVSSRRAGRRAYKGRRKANSLAKSSAPAARPTAYSKSVVGPEAAHESFSRGTRLRDLIDRAAMYPKFYAGGGGRVSLMHCALGRWWPADW